MNRILMQVPERRILTKQEVADLQLMGIRISPVEERRVIGTTMYQPVKVSRAGFRPVIKLVEVEIP
jgi:hypothetical protein